MSDIKKGDEVVVTFENGQRLVGSVERKAKHASDYWLIKSSSGRTSRVERYQTIQRKHASGAAV